MKAPVSSKNTPSFVCASNNVDRNCVARVGFEDSSLLLNLGQHASWLGEETQVWSTAVRGEEEEEDEDEIIWFWRSIASSYESHNGSFS